MADWRTNEKYRKPRKSKGTPFFIQRNYYALTALAVSGVCWWIYEYMPIAKKLRTKAKENQFQYPEGLQLRIKHIQIGRTSGPVDELLAKAREREFAKHEEKSEPKTWLGKALSSEPEL